MGDPHGTPFMTIFVSYVDRHFPNIQYFDVCGGIWRYISIYEPSFSTLFFFNFGGVHFFDIVFLFYFLVLFGLSWSYLVLFGFILSYLVLFGFILVLFGLVWSYLVLFGFVLVLFGLIWSYLVLFGLILTLFDLIWSYMTLFRYQ